MNGWACAVKMCHDGTLEDTNSLDGAHIIIIESILNDLLCSTEVVVRNVTSPSWWFSDPLYGYDYADVAFRNRAFSVSFCFKFRRFRLSAQSCSLQ